MTAHRIITLTTDFGLRDAYVAIMKAVILEINPDVALIDVSHEVSPQNVPQASYLLLTSYRYFPQDAIHLVVVDPGVGTERKGVAVATAHGIYVGPDNGVLRGALVDQGVLDAEDGALHGARAVELTNDRYRRHPVSKTFHGRDVFGPAAAHISRGVPLGDLGDSIVLLEGRRSQTAQWEGGQLRGSIIHIDHFGNAISNLPAAILPDAPLFEVSGRTLAGLASSYQESALAAIVGSAGLVEIAARNGSASRDLGISVGDPLVVRSAR